MITIKALFGLLLAAVATLGGAVVVGAEQASASSAPIVISYEKECNEATGHCLGEAKQADDVGTFVMQVTSPPRGTGKAAHLTFTEEITIGEISFTAEMNGHASPAGFIVLNGRVTEGSFAGAEVHQRSDLVSLVGTTSAWNGELRLMPASA
jgi:hypothetical protein